MAWSELWLSCKVIWLDKVGRVSFDLLDGLLQMIKFVLAWLGSVPVVDFARFNVAEMMKSSI